ncbi:MAG: adenylate/guanylate cyclase domain-containing protein [Bacteroidia bacterium]
MRKTLVLCLLLPLTSNSQSRSDSLFGIWQDHTQTDTSRVIAFQTYIWEQYVFSNPDSAVMLADQLLEYAKTKNLPYAEAVSFNLKGASYSYMGNLTQALENYHKSLALYKALQQKKNIATVLGNIGGILQDQSEYTQALAYYEQAMAVFNEIGDHDGIAFSLADIGAVHTLQGAYILAYNFLLKAVKLSETLGQKHDMAYGLLSLGKLVFYQGDYARAIEFFQASLKLEEEFGSKIGVANCLGNIGDVYNQIDNIPRALEYYERSLKLLQETGYKVGIAEGQLNMGNIYLKRGEIEKGEDYYQKALINYKAVGDKRGIANCLSFMGEIQSKQNLFEQALSYHQESLVIRKAIGDKGGITSSMRDMGRLYAQQGKYIKAAEYCRISLTLAEEEGALDKQKNACECLYDVYKAMGKGNEALFYMEKLRTIEDSLNTKEITRKLEQMEFAKMMLQDSIAKAEEVRMTSEIHQIELRRKNQSRNIFIGSSLFLLLVTGGFYSRWRYVRQSRDMISKERDRSDNLLLNILPAEIAAELKEKGRADARNFDNVSILFTDFKDFTEQSEKMSANELVNEINHCFEAFDKIMEKYGIEKIKTIGDAYMAAGGLPVPTADSVRNTVFAALEMQGFIKNRKAKNEALGHPAFEMRLGIHTGPVIAGIVGVKKFQYDIWGDTVNTASRMESSGEVGKVNISQATYAILQYEPELSFESRGKIEVKGKGEVEMYFVQLKTG